MSETKMKKKVSSSKSITKSRRRPSGRRTRQSGSALLVTLMVIVGLSLLGLGYVAISETESQISVNERNYNQVLNVAESGLKAVVEMFQDPNGALDAGILPLNITPFKNVRYQKDAGGALQAVGLYKESSTDLLFDKPFKPANTDRFLCTEQNPDVIIDRSTTEGIDFLDDLNEALFVDTTGGEITEILVYAPPIVGTPPNAQNCYDGGTRYGLATIRVTARKFDTSGDKEDENVIAQRTVKATIAEWPFPGPQGPVQSNANIATGGNLGVHWGKMTSEKDMEFANPVTSLPWHDADERVKFHLGYNSSVVWAPAASRSVGHVLRPSDAAISADPELRKFGYRVVSAGGNATPGTAGVTGATEPAWPKAIGAPNFASGTLMLQVVHSPTYAISTQKYHEHPWFPELVGKTFADPWMEVRAGGDLSNATGNQFHPYKYGSPNDSVNAIGVAGYSSWFQFQDKTVEDDQLDVVFPKMDYDFWKDVAVTGRQEDGVYYLRHVSGEKYTDGVSTKNFAQWTNVVNQGRSGFYFFDTKNGLNPQGAGAPGVLADAIAVNSSDDGSTYQAQGFIYLNVVDFGTSGIKGPDGFHNSPGEPYQDVGIRRVNETSGDWIWDTTTNQYEMMGANSGDWTFQDLKFSNNGTAYNGQFDVYVAQRDVIRHDGTSIKIWMPVPYTPGCKPGYGWQGDGSVYNCSEPHEPYLNLLYNTKGRKAGGGSAPLEFKVSWDPAEQTYRSSRVDDKGKPTVAIGSCTKDSNPRDCTSLRYDDLGSLVTDLAPFLEGVIYNEGSFENTTGNATYYGSLLIQGNVGKAGSAEVWFDEKLIKGQWPPDSFNFPRVLISSIRTDD